MIQQKLVFIHALQIRGLMLKTLPELVFSDVLIILMDRIIRDDVYQVVLSGEPSQIIQLLFVLVVALQTPLLIL